MSRFHGEAVMVTGAGSGIGKAAAAGFAAEGAAVLLVGRGASVEQARREIEALGGRARDFRGDMSLEEAAQAAVAYCVEAFGKIDVLVNAAGVGRPGAVEDITLAEWREVLDHNLTSTFLCCRAAVRAMKARGRGVIVNVSSLAGRFRSGLGGAHYAAAKAGVVGFTRQIAGELAGHNIRVNVACPGATATPMLSTNMLATRRTAAEIKRMVPLGYISEPEEQARPILFLASKEASYITGAALDVNGGIF